MRIEIPDPTVDAHKKEMEKQKRAQQELENKAKAFDLFMKKYKGYCFLDSWEINTTTHEREYIFCVGNRHEYITKEQYEILKKAGIK